MVSGLDKVKNSVPNVAVVRPTVIRHTRDIGKPGNDFGQPAPPGGGQPAAPPGGERPVLPAPGGRGHGEACLQRGQGCDGPVDAASDSETVSVQGDDVGVAQGEPGLGEPAVLAGQGEPGLGEPDVPRGPGYKNGCNVAAARPPGREQPAVLPEHGHGYERLEWSGHADQSQHVRHSGEGRSGKIFDPGGNFKHLSETYI